MVKNKFDIGDRVKFVGDSIYEVGKVVSMAFDGEGWTYKISAKEVDHEKKEIIEGFKTGAESELVAVKKEDK